MDRTPSCRPILSSNGRCSLGSRGFAARWLGVGLTASTLLGCGTSASPPGNTSALGDAGADAAPHVYVPEPRPPLGAAMTVPSGSWSFVDFPDSTCDEGTPTGIGVSAGTSNNVAIFLMGGGACWDYATCVAVGFAAHGPYQSAQFAGDASGKFRGWILDRNEPKNPVRDWNMVFVPYCTGDVHAGDNDTVYTGPGDSRTYHHRGRKNLEAFLKRIAGTWPDAGKVLISGSSAGGYGAAFGFQLARRYYPNAKAYLVDDSGPPLIGSEIADSYRAAWYERWGLGPSLDPICPACRDDFSQLVPVYAAKYPDDRMSLLETLQDKTISGYLLRPPGTFQDDVLDVASQRLDPTQHFKYFLIPGSTHTMLGSVGGYSSNGTPLWTWLTAQLSDDPAWASTLEMP